MKVIDDFNGLMHECENTKPTGEQCWRDVNGADFVRKVLHKIVDFPLCGIDHHCVQLARHRIAALHTAGIACLNEKKPGLSHFFLRDESEAVAFPSYALVALNFHGLDFEGPGDALRVVNGDGLVTEQRDRPQRNFYGSVAG